VFNPFQLQEQLVGMMSWSPAELVAEALEQVNFLVIELNRLFTMSFLETQQAVVFGEQAFGTIGLVIMADLVALLAL
jgi:hypothetical protein